MAVGCRRESVCQLALSFQAYRSTFRPSHYEHRPTPTASARGAGDSRYEMDGGAMAKRLEGRCAQGAPESRLPHDANGSELEPFVASVSTLKGAVGSLTPRVGHRCGQFAGGGLPHMVRAAPARGRRAPLIDQADN